MEERHLSFTGTYGEGETMDKVRSVCSDKKSWDLYRKNYELACKCDKNNVFEYPIQLDFELNGTCNYQCESCSYRMEPGERRREEISLEKYKEIVDEGIAYCLGAIRLNYHNEPLLKDNIDEYIKYAKDSGVMDVYLSTNGSLLTESMSQKLIDSGLDRLQISIDAFSEETYNRLRPGGNYKMVVDNILRFMEMRNSQNRIVPTVRVNFVKQKSNVGELDAFINFWKTHGVDCIGVQDFSDWENATEDVDVTYEFQCTMPYKQMVIRHTGDVLPCCMFVSQEMVVGNINKNTIKEIWDSRCVKELRAIHGTKNGWVENLTCKKCVKSLLG